MCNTSREQVAMPEEMSTRAGFPPHAEAHLELGGEAEMNVRAEERGEHLRGGRSFNILSGRGDGQFSTDEVMGWHEGTDFPRLVSIIPE